MMEMCGLSHTQKVGYGMQKYWQALSAMNTHTQNHENS